MVGLTLSPEQIRAAPPEVRRWIEQTVADALGFAARPQTRPEPPPPHLVAFGLEEARGILQDIQNLLPAVSVFFELGRESAASPAPGMRALRLVDIMSHALLHQPAQVMQCLEIINAALRHRIGDPEATFFALDSTGHCFIAETTARSILQLWQEIVAARALQSGGAEAPASNNGAQPQQPVAAEPASEFAPVGYRAA